MFAKVDVRDNGRRKVIIVPTKAVLTEGDKSLVVVATEGNVFRARRVDVGPESDGRSASWAASPPARRSSPTARSS